MVFSLPPSEAQINEKKKRKMRRKRLFVSCCFQVPASADLGI